MLLGLLILLRTKKRKLYDVITLLNAINELTNEEFKFVYGLNGKCLDGEFEVYVK